MSMDSLLQQVKDNQPVSPLELDHFHFISRGKVERQLRVIRFHGEERVNTPYEIDVEVAAATSIDPFGTLEEQLLGQPSSLIMTETGDVPRVIHGVVTSYDVAGTHAVDQVKIRLRLSARIALLKLRTHSRIFQDQTVPGVVEAILKEWRVPHKFELVASYTPRIYLTQYDETDYDFVRRLLAREGIFFYFRQNPEGKVEEVVFSDDALYKRPPGKHEKLTVRTGNFEIGEGEVIELGVRRKIRPTGARIGDFDYRHPQLPLRALELQEDPKGIPGDLGAERLGTYAFGHEAEHESGGTSEKRDRDASRLLESLRSDGLIVVGTSRSRKIVPGHSFALEGHNLEQINREWVALGVIHEGKTPEFSNEVVEVYRNEFEAGPIETAIRMPPEVRQRKVHGSQTATVVGGGEGEVFTDNYGRIKVQFHWDLEGKRDEKSSCWIRVAQAWAGPGFGSQFLPRVGTEVVVTFLDGDPDRPLVIGSVYNGTTPAPFGLPGQKSKSGFRTMSTGGEGSNELSFDDEAGAEMINVKAQRDLMMEVGHDHTTKVTGNSVLRIEGQRTETVTGNQTTTVAGAKTDLVTGQHTTQVLGDVIDAVRGNADRRVSGMDAIRIEGGALRELSSVDTFVATDATTRVRGHMTAVVGDDALPTSATVHVEGTLSGYASKTTELIAEKGIVLRCGESQLRIGPNSVEIIAPRVTLSGKQVEAGAEERVTIVSKDGVVMKSKRLHAMGESSSLMLFKNADLGGDRVRLNCKIDEAAVVAKPKPITRIQLTDDSGAPARRRRFVIVGPDGERGGVLDDKGEAELELESDAMIYFPDVDKPREA